MVGVSRRGAVRRVEDRSRGWPATRDFQPATAADRCESACSGGLWPCRANAGRLPVSDRAFRGTQGLADWGKGGRGLALSLAASTAISYAAAFLVAKVIAVSEGPAGTGLAGVVMGGAAMAATLILMGQVNNLPGWITSHPALSENQTLALALKSAGLASLLVLPIITLLILRVAGGSYGSGHALVLGFLLMAIAQVILLLGPPILSVRAGHLNSIFLSSTAVAGAVFSTVLLLLTGSIPFSLGLGYFAAAVGGLFILVLTNRNPGSPEKPSLRVFSGSWLASSPGTVINAVVIGGLPVAVFALASAEVAGLFRSAWSLSGTALAVSVVILKNQLLPLIARSGLDVEAQGRVGSLAAGAGLALPAVAGTLLAMSSPIWLRVLFSPSFQGAASATALLTLVVTARAWLSVNTYSLLGRGNPHAFSMIEGGSMALLGLTAVVSCRWDSATLIALSLATAMLSTALAAEFFTRRTLGGAAPLRGCGFGAWSLPLLQVVIVVPISYLFL